MYKVTLWYSLPLLPLHSFVTHPKTIPTWTFPRTLSGSSWPDAPHPICDKDWPDIEVARSVQNGDCFCYAWSTGTWKMESIQNHPRYTLLLLNIKQKNSISVSHPKVNTMVHIGCFPPASTSAHLALDHYHWSSYWVPSACCMFSKFGAIFQSFKVYCSGMTYRLMDWHAFT